MSLPRKFPLEFAGDKNNVKFHWGMKYSETFRRLGRLDKTVDDEEVVTCFQGIILSLQTKFTPS